MAIVRKQLHYRGAGSFANNEEWWYLVFDDNSNRLFVEREWDNVNPYKLSQVDRGSQEIELTEFLKQKSGAAHDELLRLIGTMFEKSKDQGG